MITIDAEAMKNDDYLGVPLTDRAFHCFKELRKAQCLSGPVFYDLRHTFASYLRQQGVDLHTISKLLGHKDLRITKRYAHLNVDSLRGTISRLSYTFSSRSAEDRHAGTV